MVEFWSGFPISSLDSSKFWSASSQLYAMDAAFISDETLINCHHPFSGGKTRVGGVDVNKPRMQAVLSAALALVCSPKGFTARQFSAAVSSILGIGEPNYDPRRAAYDLKKLRAKTSCQKWTIPADTRFRHKLSAPSQHW